jgi:hypothetical protein
VAGVSEASTAYVAAVKAAAISSDELKARFGSLGAEARLALWGLLWRRSPVPRQAGHMDKDTEQELLRADAIGSNNKRRIVTI